MSGYVDEKVAKVSLDNRGFTKNVEDTIAALNRLKKAFDNVNGKSAANNIDSDMTQMMNTISKSTTKSEGLLSRLKGIFSKSTEGIDMSGASRSIDKMNTDVANRTSRTSDILSRLKGIFQKADNHEGFPNTLKSIDGLNNKIAVFDASPLAAAFEKAASSVNNSMSIMNIAVGNALSGMVQKAMSFTGQFFRGPMDGLGEYKDKLGSIQTIMTNTEWEIPDSSVRMRKVSGSLQELNDYADKTIYSFADMTKNIGTFTAAGVSLDKAGTAIKGISNLAAASGSNTQQASTAMYQLSQAIAAGRVGLQDWNSVVNAGMGGKLFQDRLTQTAEKLGHARNMTKSFRESLQDGWLTSEVLLETLREFSEDQSMLDAATKVKSFGQLVDTVQESIGSGWATTWEYLLGGFEEARDMWTKIGDIVNPFYNDDQGKYYDEVTGLTLSLGNYRNALLKTWKDMGGQQSLFNAIANSFEFVFGAMTKYREGFRSVIGDYKTNARVFFEFTKGLENLTIRLKNNDSIMHLMTNTGKAFGNILVTIGWAIKALATGFGRAAPSVNGLISPISNLMFLISQFFASIRSNTNVYVGLIYMGKAIANVFAILISVFRIAIIIIRQFFSAFSGGDGSGFLTFAFTLFKITQAIREFMVAAENAIKNVGLFQAVGDFIANVFKGIFAVISAVFGKILGLTNPFTGLSTILSGAASAISKSGEFINKALTGLSNKMSSAWDGIVNGFKKGYEGLKDAFVSFDISSIIKAIIGLFALDKWIAFKNSDNTIFDTVFGKIKDTFTKFTDNGKKMAEDAGGVLDTFKNNLNMFSQGVKVWLLVGIAAAVFMLAISIEKLSKLDMRDLSKGLIGMGAAMFGLMKSMKVLGNISALPKGAIATMIGYAIAIRILAGAMMKLAEIPQEEMGKAILGLYAAMVGLLASIKIMSKIGGSEASVLKMIGLAIAVRILVMSVKAIADMEPAKLATGVIGVQALLLGLAVAAKIIDGVKPSVKAIQSLSVFAFAVRVLVMSVAKLADIPFLKLIPAVASVEVLLLTLAICANAISGVKVKMSAMMSLIVFAGTIRLLTKSIEALAGLDVVNMIASAAAVEVLLVTLAAAAVVLNKVKINLSTMALMITFAASIYALVKSIEVLAYIPVTSLIKALGGVEILLVSLVAMTYLMQKAKPKLGSAALLAGFGLAILFIVKSIEPLVAMPVTSIIKGLVTIEILLASMVALGYAMNKVKFNPSAALSMIALSLMLVQVTSSLKQLSSMDWKSLLAATAAISGVMLSLAFTVKIINSSVDDLVAIGELRLVFDSFGSLLYGIGAALEQASKLQWQQMLVALGGIIGVLGALVTVTWVMDKINPNMETVGGLAVFAAILYAVGDALSKVAAQPWQGIAAATVAIAVVLGTLVGMSILLDKFGSFSGVGQLVVLAAGLMALAIPIMLLSSLNLVAVGVSLLALAGNLAILLAAAALAQLVAPGLAALSGALMTFGISSILAATSLLIAGAGFLAFVLAIKELVSIAPAAFKAIVDAINNLLSGLASNAPSMVSSIIKIIKTSLEGLVELVPYITRVGVLMLIGFLKGIRDSAPELITTAVEMLTTLASALTDNLDTLLTVAIEIAVQFIQSLANALMNVKDKLIPALTSLFMVITEIVVALIQNLAGPILNAIATVLGPIIQLIVDFITQLAPALTPIIQIIGDVLKVLIENLPAILQPIADTIQVLVAGIVAALEILAPIVTLIIQGIITIVLTLAPIVQSVVDAIVVALNIVSQAITVIGDVIDRVVTGIENIVQTVADTITTVIQGIPPILQALGQAFESVGNAIKTALEGVGSVVESVGTAIKTALEGVGKVFESIGNAIKSVLEGVADVIRSVGESAKNFGEGFKLLGEGIKLIGENGSAAASGLGSFVVEALKLAGVGKLGLGGTINDLEKLSSVISGLSSSSGTLSSVSSGMMLLSTSLTIISGVIPTVNAALESMSTSIGNISPNIQPVAASFQLLSTPIGILASTLGGVAAGFIILSGQLTLTKVSLDGIAASFEAIQNGVTIMSTNIGLVGPNIDLLSTSLTAAKDSLMNFGIELTNSSNGFIQLGTGATIGMTAMNTAVMVGMGTVQTTMLTSIGLLAGAVTEGFVLVSTAVQTSMGMVTTAVQTGMQGVVTTISSNMGVVAAQMSTSLGGVVNVVTSSMSRVSGAIQSSMSQVTGTIQNASSQMSGTFNNLSSTAQSTISNMMSSIVSRIQSGMSSANSTVNSNMSSIISTISSYSGSASSSGYNIGYNISAGIANGIWANVGSIESAAQRIINKANEAARAAADIHSPSRLFAKTVGKYIPQGIAMGIDKEMPKSIQQMSDTFKNGFSDATSSAVSHGTALAEAVANAVNQVGDMMDVAVDDMNYTPTITPVIDTKNLNKFSPKDYGLTLSGMTNVPTPVYSPQSKSPQTTTINTDNSTKEYRIEVSVDNGGHPVNPKELAKQVQEHIKEFDDQNRRARGEEVFW